MGVLNIIFLCHEGQNACGWVGDVMGFLGMFFCSGKWIQAVTLYWDESWSCSFDFGGRRKINGQYVYVYQVLIVKQVNCFFYTGSIRLQRNVTTTLILCKLCLSCTELSKIANNSNTNKI